MKIEIIFVKNDGKVDKDKTPVLLKLNYDNRYVIQKDHYISLDDEDYCVLAVKGVYEDSELVKIIAKVQKDKF